MLYPISHPNITQRFVHFLYKKKCTSKSSNEKMASAAKNEPQVNCGKQEHLDHSLLKGKFTLSIWVPKEQVGMVIGKKGAMISHIQRESQTKLLIPPQPDESLWFPIVIKGDPSGTFGAYRIISDLVEEIDDCVGEFPLPSKKHSAVIGKGGMTIRRLSAESNVRIHVPSRRDPNPITNNIQLEGSVENVFKCLGALLEVVLSGGPNDLPRGDRGVSPVPSTGSANQPPPPARRLAGEPMEATVEIPESKLRFFGPSSQGSSPTVLEDLHRLTGVSFQLMGQRHPTPEEVEAVQKARDTRRALRAAQQQAAAEKRGAKATGGESGAGDAAAQQRGATSGQEEMAGRQPTTACAKQTTNVKDGGEAPAGADQGNVNSTTEKMKKIQIEEGSADHSEEEGSAVAANEVDVVLHENSESDSDDEDSDDEASEDSDDEFADALEGHSDHTDEQADEALKTEEDVKQTPNRQDAAEETEPAPSGKMPERTSISSKKVALPEIPQLVSYTIYKVEGDKAAVEVVLEVIRKILGDGKARSRLIPLRDQWPGPGPAPELLTQVGSIQLNNRRRGTRQDRGGRERGRDRRRVRLRGRSRDRGASTKDGGGGGEGAPPGRFQRRRSSRGGRRERDRRSRASGPRSGNRSSRNTSEKR